MSDLPFPGEEPDANQRAMAKAFRQMYVALCQEGFTSEEALGFVHQAFVQMLTKALNDPPNS